MSKPCLVLLLLLSILRIFIIASVSYIIGGKVEFLYLKSQGKLPLQFQLINKKNPNQKLLSSPTSSFRFRIRNGFARTV
jgi:hypothetical protein